MNNQALIIADTTIRTDAEGRYCLNDLHKAAGGDPKNKPANFTRLAETSELIAELVNGSDVSSFVVPMLVLGGRNGGTFVVKELVYAYAMWISPAFHLKVIRAYDTLQTQGIAVADHAAGDLLTNPLAYFEKVLAQAKQIQVA
ncbi:hypothetical protein BZY95_06370 [Billgrantia desiderata SP1]|uniref:KilA-N domain-containing protein n=1 Tax=Billgrantia desiderata TaxID=52021 RepID=UPI000A36DB96|nr:KilA-N domain-containing protein [Halomonas desiderata]OUE44362.1 hypothetical protein BZY95_06370 [Halomonas desiderata SP1]